MAKPVKTTSATFVKEIVVTDPDSHLPVNVTIYKEEGGGMFGVDSSFLENDVGEVVSPFGNGLVELSDEDEGTEGQDRADYSDDQDRENYQCPDPENDMD